MEEYSLDELKVMLAEPENWNIDCLPYSAAYAITRQLVNALEEIERLKQSNER